MMDLIASQIGYVVVISLFAMGALGSFLLQKKDELANAWQHIFAIAGSASGMIFSAAVISMGRDVSFSILASVFPFLSFSFCIDTLSAFFIFVISLIALFSSVYGIGYVKHFYKRYSIGALGVFYHLFIAGMLLVVSVSNGIFFLIVWEIMSVASYFLVVYDRKDGDNVKAGFLYLIMTHIGTAFIIFALLLLYKSTASFDFETIRHCVPFIPISVKNAVFVLAMIGFGTKAGIIPLHIWLPGAHPAAPSHVSALMSGVMIKTGIYMMIRIFWDMLYPVPMWWGIVILIIGAVSALLGVLYALTEHDIKRLLAYHSIENVGIILLGFGSALVFASVSEFSLALLGLAAALFHILNHATFKSLLFLGAGSVINQTHSRNMEEYGGLIKCMPYTAFFFLIGSMAISALPPFNGFASEWMTFQALFQGIASSNFLVKWAFISAAGALAFTGGLALACFVKAFGSTFLARPRSEEVKHAKESSFALKLGMGALAMLCILFGIFSSQAGSALEFIGNGFGVFRQMPSLARLSSVQGLVVPGGLGSSSPMAFFLLSIFAIALVVLIAKHIINKGQLIKTGSTWDCGSDLTPRMEITATGFARSIVLIFAGILRPSIQRDIEYRDSEMRYLPKSRKIHLGVHDIYQSYLYQPLHKLVDAMSLRVKNIQSGNINAYICYIFVALIIALFFIK